MTVFLLFSFYDIYITGFIIIDILKAENFLHLLAG